MMRHANTFGVVAVLLLPTWLSGCNDPGNMTVVHKYDGRHTEGNLVKCWLASVPDSVARDHEPAFYVKEGESVALRAGRVVSCAPAADAAVDIKIHRAARLEPGQYLEVRVVSYYKGPARTVSTRLDGGTP